MRYRHILLEGYCSFDKPKGNVKCKNMNGEMGQQCIECKYFSYIDAPNSLVLVNNKSVTEKVEDFCAYREELIEQEDIDKWNEICRRKMVESLDEFDSFMENKNIEKNQKKRINKEILDEDNEQEIIRILDEVIVKEETIAVKLCAEKVL